MVFQEGAKVEYFSRTMNGWVLSYVKGVNPDGTYKLNTKKAADPKLVRSLIDPEIVIRRPLLTCRSKSSSENRRTASHGPFLCSLGSQRMMFAGQKVDLRTFHRDIFDLLGVSSHLTLTKMTGFSGGQNDGVWFITEPSTQARAYCLKVVKSGRIFDGVTSERENYIALLSRFPGLLYDAHLTFPQKILVLPQNDVFVMPVARGDRMAEVVSRIVSSGSPSTLRDVFRAVGRRLKLFHADYGGINHGDLQTSNIFIDMCQTSAIYVTFIDLGGMGANLGKSDVTYFLESIGLLGKTYGTEFERAATSAFVDGYTTN
jgi:tRNA A-37 threonylcarbamoyl transferase component Bud32